MTHPAQHHVDAAKKRQRAWVEGGARGGSSNRPGKAGALKGGASEDRETQSDTRPLVPHLRDARFPPPDTVAGAEEQKERARGGALMRASGGPTIPTPPYAGARTADNRVDPSPATADKNEMRQMPSRDERDYAGKELGLARGGASFRTPSGGVSAAARHEAEGKRETMPGGKFPIRNAADLANAKHDVGRASDPAAARHWINKRAKELGEPPLGG